MRHCGALAIGTAMSSSPKPGTLGRAFRCHLRLLSSSLRFCRLSRRQESQTINHKRRAGVPARVSMMVLATVVQARATPVRRRRPRHGRKKGSVGRTGRGGEEQHGEPVPWGVGGGKGFVPTDNSTSVICLVSFAHHHRRRRRRRRHRR